MPTDKPYHFPDMASILAVIKPNSFLDVGCGFGRWGFLAREVCDVCAGRYCKKDWKVRIDAVEAFGDYIQSWHREIYDNIYPTTIQEHTMEPYDVIFAGDVFEHLDASDIQPILSKLLAYADKALLVAVPLGSSPQGELYGNPYERHKSTWTVERLKFFRPDYIKTYLPDGKKALAVWSGFRLQNMGPRLNGSKAIDERPVSVCDPSPEGFYDQFAHSDISRYEKIYELVGEWAQGAVLDIGCGVAKLQYHIENYSGFDFNTECVKMANTDKVWKGSAYTEDLDGYDTYVALEVLEHLDDIRLIERLPAGKFFVFSVPSFAADSHLRTYTEEGLRERFSRLMNIGQTVRFNFHDRRWVAGGEETGIFITLCKAVIRSRQ